MIVLVLSETVLVLVIEMGHQGQNTCLTMIDLDVYRHSSQSVLGFKTCWWFLAF